MARTFTTGFGVTVTAKVVLAVLTALGAYVTVTVLVPVVAWVPGVGLYVHSSVTSFVVPSSKYAVISTPVKS